MPTFYVDYTCGHRGPIEISMGVGRAQQREDRAKFLARHRVCKDCHTAKLRERAAKIGPLFYCREIEGETEVVCHFQSYPIKDVLKSRGYKFDGVDCPRD